MENKKIIVIDHANIMHKAIFAFRNNYSVPATFTYCAMIIGYLKKIGFNSKEDEVILAIDYGKSWRKLEDPTYKKQRKAMREEIESPEWWAEMYGEFNNFLPILEKALPWYFVKLYNIEADDIASVCCRYYKDKEIILISADNDWTMLCHYSNVKVFSPYNKKYKIIKNPMKVLLDKIQGDKCLDGNTYITMNSGNKLPIKNVKIGDVVAGYNFHTKKVIPSKVLKTGTSKSIERLLLFLDNDKCPLKITPNHRVYTKYEWKEAHKLQKGEIIYKYNELKLLSNGRKIRKIINTKTKSRRKFINYNITTETQNYFASDCLVHNSDNLLTKPSSEMEFERRKKIVNLLELPTHIESEIREQLDKFTPKGTNLYKIKFKTIRERFAQLYNLQKEVK